MIQADPIIAVKNVAISSKWYQALFGCRLSGGHGGERFETLTDEDGSVLLCLHKWGEDHHPTMTNLGIPPGNGLILYFRTDNLDAIRKNAQRLGAVIEEDIHRNPNSGKEEFSIWDLDGYYLTITRYHDYGYGYK
ncbi:MAG TPA: VOC family protein [Arachidicoccus sp.]|nr:VOC family protein [Arachidicoccus sp.]